MKTKAIGIAIGGTKVAVTTAFVGHKINIVNKTVFPTDAYHPDKILKEIFNILDKKVPFDTISVISGGPLDVKNGIIVNPPHLPGFIKYPIVKKLNDRYHCPVSLLNDADAGALAEYKFGAGRGSHNMAFLTFGTGLGAGLVLDGQLYTGNNGMAGEIGHVRLYDSGPMGYGKQGSVEAYCAGGNINKWAKDYIKNKTTSLNNYAELTTKHIAQEANNGDAIAKEIFDIVIHNLGRTVSILIDVLNLDRVVIGGIYPRNEKLLKDKLLEEIKKETIPINFEVCEIVPSQLGESIDDYASLAGAILEEHMNTIYERYPKLKPQENNIESAIDIIDESIKNGGKILVCGNGGSAADASHIVSELMKGFLSKRPLPKNLKEKLPKDMKDQLQQGIPCIDLAANGPLNTAISNDVKPELIFAQQVIGYSANTPEDVLIAISTSGNSKNVVNAVRAAQAIGVKSIALTGDFNSELSKIATICIKAPEQETYRVQEYHLPIYHYICMELEKRI